MNGIHPFFFELPEALQKQKLELIDYVNEKCLHCTANQWHWAKFLITQQIAVKHFQNLQKKEASSPSLPKQNPKPIDQNPAARLSDSMVAINASSYNKVFESLIKVLNQTYLDPDFTEALIEAAHTHFGILKRHAELAIFLLTWVNLNSVYLPLGEHLLPAFDKDRKKESAFYRHIMVAYEVKWISEAQSDQAYQLMKAFLAEAGAANERCLAGQRHQEGPPTAIVLSVKNGAGGHTAPQKAMAARLKERGYKVETINYDTNLDDTHDYFRMLGITFVDGTKMTEHSFSTRWIMQKHNKEISKIVKYYCNSVILQNPSLFKDYSGKDLLLKKIIPLNPKLIVTTMAYHWSWQSIAYRLPYVKTLMVASDVNFHSVALFHWYRQKDLEPSLRNIYFTSMTDDLDLFKSEYLAGKEHQKKHPENEKVRPEIYFSGLEFDEQITVIGAPINPEFQAVTSEVEIQRLRKKWGLPDDAVSVCISRGKLAYNIDLIPAVEGFRTDRTLSMPLHLHVVCGENISFYNRLCAGEMGNLGPNITVIPHPLLEPKDFAELRAISIIDDIKAGGASTFEGWYLISQGARSKLLLTPGEELWLEYCNCWAMEKWGVGSLAIEGQSKIPFVEETIAQGVPHVKHHFPDWKTPFDSIVKKLFTTD